MLLSRLKGWYLENRDSCLMLLGVFLGLIFGFTLKAYFTISPQVLTYMTLPGQLLVRVFMLLLVPLIVASLSTGISALGGGQNKRFVFLSLLLIVCSTTFSSILGITMISIIRPGVTGEDIPEISHKQNSTHGNTGMEQMVTSQDIVFYDVFINLVPDNLVGATFMTHYTAIVPINAQNLSQGYKTVAEKNFQPNLLGLVVIAFMVGFSLLHLEERAHTIRALLEETNLIVTEIIMFLIMFMPFAMFCFMTVDAIKMKAPGFEIIIQLLWFGFTNILVFLIIMFISWPILYFVIVHKNPYKMYLNIMPAILVALGSSSSAMTLPMTMKCMEGKNKLAPSVSHFFLPLGMTMHMAGTAAYCPMVAIFLAQMHGISLSFPLLATLAIYSVIMSMAFPATPSQGAMVFFVTICVLIGIENPLELMAYIKAIDLVMGRLRTTINIVGDCILSKIVEKVCNFDQEQIDDTQDLKIVSRL